MNVVDVQHHLAARGIQPTPRIDSFHGVLLEDPVLFERNGWPVMHVCASRLMVPRSTFQVEVRGPGARQAAATLHADQLVTGIGEWLDDEDARVHPGAPRTTVIAAALGLDLLSGGVIDVPRPRVPTDAALHSVDGLDTALLDVG